MSKKSLQLTLALFKPDIIANPSATNVRLFILLTHNIYY